MTGLHIGDTVKMKKKHPCGCDEFTVTREGADFKIRCNKCSHEIMLTRVKFEKAVKKLLMKNEATDAGVNK